MKSKFKIPKEFDGSTNESIRCIREDEGVDYSCESPDRMMPLEKYKKLTRADIMQMYSSSAMDQYSIFNQHRLEQLAELDRVKEEWLNFLINPNNTKNRPLDILDRNLYYKVRLMKMRETLKPQFALVNVEHPKTKYKYIVAKAYDWNDMGVRVRSFNKSIIRTEGEHRVVKKLQEIYEGMDYEVRTDVSFFVGIEKVRKIADMVISKGSKEYAVEIKMSEESLSRFIVAEAMWEAYKLKYKISL
jgi:hypothetical protein